MYMHKWDLSLTKINIFHIHSISTNQVQNILDHTYTFIYIYINVNTGKQIEVNTFNLFIFFNPCFICKVNDHLGKSLLLVIIHILNFKQNWIKPMHEDGFFSGKELFLPAYYLDIITVIKLSVGSLFYCIDIIMNL